MIAAMLTMTVMTLLMVVALMFAAEVGWLMVDPTPRGNRPGHHLIPRRKKL
jgi:hypothetical protein